MRTTSTGCSGTSLIIWCRTRRAALDAYQVIRDALRQTGRIALGRVVMHTRERLVALEPRDKGIIVYTLRMRDEVADPAKAFDDIPAGKPDKQMIEIAAKIIEQQEGSFDPDKFKDRYENALRDLIRRKEKGEKIVTAEPVEDDNVIDLMEALKKSLKHKGRAEETREARQEEGEALARQLPDCLLQGFLAIAIILPGRALFDAAPARCGW